MLKIIFVDDEAITLRLLEQILDWEKYGIVVAGSASNAIEGLELFEKVEPDIVIADIKMPGMNGVEFAEELRKRSSTVKIVFLSAYAEFEYARKAIACRVSDYLLKPLDEDKLEELIERLVKELRESKRTGTRNRDIETYVKKEYTAYCNWLEDNERTDGYQPGYELPAEYENCYCILEKYPFERAQAEMVGEQLVATIEDCMRKKYIIWTPCPTQLYLLVERGEISGEELCKRLKEQAYEVRIGMERLHTHHMAEAMKIAEEAAEYTFWIPENAMEGRKIGLIGRKILLRMEDWKEAITQLVISAESTAIMQLFNEMLEEAQQQYVQPSSLWRNIEEIFIHIRIAVTKTYLDTELTVNAFRHGDRYRLRACADKNELLKYIRGQIEHLVETEQILMEEVGYSVIIQYAKRYVEDNYSRSDFTLNDVAEYVGLSRNYFSKLFHDVTGIKFWDYVSVIRIRRASELLLDKRSSVGEISSMVGYETESHFNKKFKQIMGMPPGAYRKRMDCKN